METRPYHTTILIITFSRVLFAFLFLIIFDIDNTSSVYIGLILALLGQASDNLDGYIVRKISHPTTEGYIQDSISDKLFLIGFLIAIQREFEISLLVTWLVVSRELIILASRILIKNLNHTLNKLKIYSIIYNTCIRLSMFLFIIQPLFLDIGNYVLLLANMFLFISLVPALIGQIKIMKVILA